MHWVIWCTGSLFLGKLFWNWNQVDVQDHHLLKGFFSFDQTFVCGMANWCFLLCQFSLNWIILNNTVCAMLLAIFYSSSDNYIQLVNNTDPHCRHYIIVWDPGWIFILAPYRLFACNVVGQIRLLIYVVFCCTRMRITFSDLIWQLKINYVLKSGILPKNVFMNVWKGVISILTKMKILLKSL